MLVGREKLYEEVWAQPMLAVAQRYQVTPLAVSKAGFDPIANYRGSRS